MIPFIYIYIQAVVARDKLDMSYLFEEFIVILKLLELKVNNHVQAKPAYLFPTITKN